MDSKRIFKLASITTILMLLISTVTMMSALGEVDAPKKQMKNGISADEVICNDGLQLMIRTNGNAMCVKNSSTIRLVDSGIGKVVPNNPIPKETEEIISEQKTTQNQVKVTIENIPPQKSSKIITIEPDGFGYQPGDTINFSGKAIGKQNLELTLIDPNDKEVFFEVLEVNSSGTVSFDVPTKPTFIEGRYFLIAEQSDDSEITPILIGYSSEDIHMIVDDFYNDLNSELLIEMFGSPLSEVELTIYDSKKHEKFTKDIIVESSGYAEITINLEGYKAGIYSAVLTQGTEDVTKDFAVGLKTGSTLPVKLSITKNSYIPDDTVLIFGTASSNSRIILDVINPLGDLVHEIESYTGSTGKMSARFELPTNAMPGKWKITTVGKSNASEITFKVTEIDAPLTVELDKSEPYATGDVLSLSGSGVNTVSQIAISIMYDSLVEEFDIFATEDGDFSLSWQIPTDLESGTYTMIIDDGNTSLTQNFEIINTFYD